MGTERDRVISITLTETEWQAFVARQPQPVEWLRGQIQTQIQTASRVEQPDVRRQVA